ncbi:hypothetical protein B0I35DRAFT_237181 [Stachybotrys elegans]|uniref:Uncharacterized protein n=1 Tax=Stachybotrys elegans TaxID=80388 RepID=A0A8K0SS58_9HYPO|nr:hypothetical protein B0I35DRAFT_237181 [Stachybotrys elegans]
MSMAGERKGAGPSVVERKMGDAVMSRPTIWLMRPGGLTAVQRPQPNPEIGPLTRSNTSSSAPEADRGRKVAVYRHFCQRGEGRRGKCALVAERPRSRRDSDCDLPLTEDCSGLARARRVTRSQAETVLGKKEAGDTKTKSEVWSVRRRKREREEDVMLCLRKLDFSWLVG